MSKKKDHFMLLDPAVLRFTHARIRPFFSGCGRRVEDTIADLLEGRITLQALPVITVILGADNHMFSLNNRRLYVLKSLREAGYLAQMTPPHHVRVRVKQATPKELIKYTPAHCSLTATIMGVDQGDISEESDEEVEKSTYDSILNSLKGKAKAEIHKAVKLSQKGKLSAAQDIVRQVVEDRLLTKSQGDIIIADFISNN